MMQMRFAMGILLIVLLGASHAADPAAEAVKVSKPFAYAGYSVPEYTSFKTTSEYVTMSDGARVAVDVHLPAGGPDRTAFPVIFEYTPYQRSTIDPETGKVHDVTDTREGKFFLSYGYALVRADMRGTGASMGWLMDFMPRLGKDGFQVVEWIARQPWCDGNVGMTGSSYLGWSQMAVAARAPRALKCIAPECIPLDGYTGEAYPGGIFLEGFFKPFSDYMRKIEQNYNLPNEGIRPTKPAADENHDGKFNDEIPMDVNGNGTFLDDGFPPKYRDGQERAGIYYQATLDHQKGNHDYMQWASACRFIDSPTPLGYTLYDLSPSGHVPSVMRSAIPIYHFGGWFDAFTRGSFELYCTMAKSNPSKLVMVPSYHDFTSGPWWKHFGFTPEQVEDCYLTEHLRFFDRYLKGVHNGIAGEPPIYLYVMNGGGWRFEQEWPLARAVATTFYLDGGNALRRKTDQQGTDTYTADLSHDARYAGNHGNRYLGIIGECPNALPVRTEQDKKCLTYTTDALGNDREVTGHPIVHLWASSTAADGDFFVYLEDVNESGEAVLVTEGQLRAGFAALHDNAEMVKVGKFKIEVLPKLPWHGFREREYDPKVFDKGAAVELVIDLNPTSWVFKKGHRVRVSIACADYPTFRLHPALSPQNNPSAPDNIAPTITVYRDASHPSHIELPIIPAAPPNEAG